MSLVKPVRDIFAEPMPEDADLPTSTKALKGKTDADLSQADIDTLGPLAEVFQDFSSDPVGWIKSKSGSQPRCPNWIELAEARGSGAQDIEPEQGIDPDTLAGGAPPPSRRESDSGRRGGGISIRTSDDGDAPPKRGRDKDERKSKDRGDGPQAGDNQSSAGKTSQPADRAQSAPAPDLVHGFQSVQDLGRVGGELVRERTAAIRRETPGAQKKRLDAEAAERQRRLDEDARERQRRQMEEEEALRRRLAIQAEADEAKRLADLRLAAEKQRLDEEAEERREERKRAREEPRERKPPEPPLDRNLPPLGMMVIQTPKYIDLRDRLMAAVQRERHGEDGAQDEVRQLGREIIRLAGSNNRLEELAGGMLHRLRRSLAAWEDVHNPKTFQANYITGIYAD